MSATIHFQCRSCECEVVVSPSEGNRVSCPRCRADIRLFMNDSIVNRGVVTACVSCGHDALYVQKDFNRKAGVAIVAAGIIVSVYFFARGQPLFAMAALGATALIDFLAYFFVPQVTVCYTCHAIYRGFEPNPEHEPFELARLEKYGGRKPRELD